MKELRTRLDGFKYQSSQNPVNPRVTELISLRVYTKISLYRITRSVSAFQSSVNVRKDGRCFDLKSVTGVMMANAKHGDIVTVEIDGPDEETAAQALEVLFAEKFGET